MNWKAFLTKIELGVILKQIADWCRTVSAGAFILGSLNPAFLGNSLLMNKAFWVIGVPGMLACLFLSLLAAKFEAWKKGD